MFGLVGVGNTSAVVVVVGVVVEDITVGVTDSGERYGVENGGNIDCMCVCL